MKIIISSTHIDQDLFWAKILTSLGHTVYFPTEKLSFNCVISQYKNHPEMNLLKYDDFLNMEDKDIVFFIQYVLQEQDMINFYASRKPNSKLVYVTGNNMHEGGYGKLASKNIPKNVVAFDIQTMEYWADRGCRNIAIFYPFYYMKEYDFCMPIIDNSNIIINTYIQEYDSNPYFNSTRQKYMELCDILKDKIKTYRFGVHNKDGLLYNPEYILTYKTDVPLEKQQITHIKRSWATAHIKPYEGYGFNIVKSMMIGRPVIAFREHIIDKTCQNLLLDGYNAILGNVERVKELANKIIYYIERTDQYITLCLNASNHIRNLTDISYSKLQIEKLFQYLQ